MKKRRRRNIRVETGTLGLGHRTTSRQCECSTNTFRQPMRARNRAGKRFQRYVLLWLEICGSWSPINAMFEPNSKWILVLWAQQEGRPLDLATFSIRFIFLLGAQLIFAAIVRPTENVASHKSKSFIAQRRRAILLFIHFGAGRSKSCQREIGWTSP